MQLIAPDVYAAQVVAPLEEKRLGLERVLVAAHCDLKVAGPVIFIPESQHGGHPASPPLKDPPNSQFERQSGSRLLVLPLLENLSNPSL